MQHRQQVTLKSQQSGPPTRDRTEEVVEIVVMVAEAQVPDEEALRTDNPNLRFQKAAVIITKSGLEMRGFVWNL